MSENLQLAVTESFGDIQTKIYRDENGNMFMTAKQLGECLNYTNGKRGIDILINRNPYLKDKEFSGTFKLKVPNKNGYSSQSTRVFNEDGIYEVTFLAKTDKAQEFRCWVRKILKSIRNGEISSIVTITPKTAAKLLKNNLNNRPINITRVKALAQDMLMGKWEVNGETIKIYEDGTLADGQHRLSACVMAGVPFQTYIVKNLQKNVLPTIDCGEKRSIVHGLRMKGIEIDSKLIPALNLLFNKGSKMTSPQIEFLFTKYNNECRLITNLLPRNNLDLRSKSPFRAFCLYLLIVKDFNEENLNDFVNGMSEKPTCITNFEQTCFYFRRWYERNIFGKRSTGCGSFNKANLRIREIDGLFYCLDSFNCESLIDRFRYTGRAMCELEKCSHIAKSDFKQLEEQTMALIVQP